MREWDVGRVKGWVGVWMAWGRNEWMDGCKGCRDSLIDGWMDGLIDCVSTTQFQDRATGGSSGVGSGFGRGAARRGQWHEER